MNQFFRFAFTCILWAVLSGGVLLHAQEQDSTHFQATGKPVLTLFADFHNEFTKSGPGRAGFALKRIYLGYKYAFHPNFTAAVKLDIGSPDDIAYGSGLKRYAYFKNAYLEYHTSRFQWAFGLVSTKMFKLSEKYWGHRYIAKPYLDQYRYGPSADLGMIVTYKFLPTLSADLSLLNGEGYYRLQLDTAFRYALGITWQPAGKWIFRGYGDIYRRPFTRSVVSFFSGYKSDHLTAGWEVAYYFNAGAEEKTDMWGASASFSWNFTEHLQYFGRLDYLNGGMRGVGPEPGDLSRPGNGVTSGIQYSPIKQVRMALTWRSFQPVSMEHPSSNWIFFNLGVKL